MKPRTTIFLSGVSHEFGSFRDAVAIAIQKKGGADNQPAFAPDYHTVEEMRRRRLHDCDAVIHVVGFRFRAEPSESKLRPASAPRRSQTQIELHIAGEMGKPIHVFLSNDASLRDPAKSEEKPEDADLAALQLAKHLVEEVDGHALTLQIMGGYLQMSRIAAFGSDLGPSPAFSRPGGAASRPRTRKASKLGC